MLTSFLNKNYTFSAHVDEARRANFSRIWKEQQLSPLFVKRGVIFQMKIQNHGNFVLIPLILLLKFSFHVIVKLIHWNDHVM